MRPSLLVTTALLIAACLPSRSRAQSRVSIEVGGMVSAYDVSSPQSTGVARGALTSASTGTGGNAPTSATVAGGGGSAASQAIAAFEVRPTITMESGFLMGVGFRAGQAGLNDSGSSLIGGDVAVGYAHRFGPFLPFIKGMFGFNNYDSNDPRAPRQTDLRLDAVLGSRLYVSKRIYLAAAAFAGWGDHYGGSVSIGGDVIQVFSRGRLP